MLFLGSHPQVGDIVKVQRNEEFPCDLVMLSSADPLGQCFVTTSNLDGETNLKVFKLQILIFFFLSNIWKQDFATE